LVDNGQVPDNFRFLCPSSHALTLANLRFQPNLTKDETSDTHCGVGPWNLPETSHTFFKISHWPILKFCPRYQ